MLGSRDYAREQYTNEFNQAVERLVLRRPLRWKVVCLKCLGQQNVDHEKVPYVRCKNAACGKAAVKPAPSMARTGTREEATRSANAAASRAFHHEDDTGNLPPVKRDVDSGYFESSGFTNDRERQSYRQFIKEFAKEQERPLREAETKLQNTANKLAALERDRIANGVDDDDKFFLKPDELDDVLASEQYSDAQLDGANKANGELFRQVCFDYLPSEANMRMILDYLTRNLRARHLPIGFLPANLLIRTYVRLNSYGLLERPQEVYVEPEPRKESYDEALERHEREEQARLEDEQSRKGTDWRTGQSRIFSAREIRLMSADEYKRAFLNRIAPTIRDLFEAGSEWT